MEKLNNLIKRCKNGVYLTINKHRDYYRTVEQFMALNTTSLDIDNDIYIKMKESDTIIELRFYPDNDISYYIIFHYDLQLAIEHALSLLK